ncbi:hypothetical protein [Maribacter spongiicola]|uniref:hypothetical protein n=1 Tax=Maribacter spongiicola TaxID=1206753 RepID=UPI003F95D557
MKTISDYISNHIDVFCPNSNELLLDFIHNLGYNNFDSLEVKLDVLRIIEILLDLDLIYRYKWYDKSLKLNKEQTINNISDIWTENVKYEDFYNMVYFGSTDWYVKKLENLGMSQTTDWRCFVKNKIGDLEKFIQSEKPKNIEK